jgi:rubrerythrin
MKTSKEWWVETRTDEVKLIDWLQKQWRGEVTAAERIMRFADQFAVSGSNDYKVLDAIASQERIHAHWIERLLEARGLKVDTNEILNAEKRYWLETLPGITDFATGAAVAAHAEGMRLERIRAIAEDPNSPADIRNTFIKILKDEEWHESAFTKLSNPEALEATLGNHEAGMQTLGLVH